MNVGDYSESGNVINYVLSVHHSVIRSAISGMFSAFSAKSPDGRSVWRHATQDGELWQTGGKCHGGLSGVLFWRCGLMIGRVLTGLGSPVRSRKAKKSCCSLLIRHALLGVQIQTPALETVLRSACLDVRLQLTVCCLLDHLALVDASLFVSLLACGPAMGLIDVQFIETTKTFPNKKDN